MRLDVITIFPDYLAPLNQSLLGKAQQRGLLSVAVHDLRQWTDDNRRTVDAAPYGGGPGLVMRPDPWGRALSEVCTTEVTNNETPLLILPSPSGIPFTQALAAQYATQPWLIFACGRYEGIDQRVVDYAAQRMSIAEVSLGDYVLCGGEAAVLVIAEAVARLIPGVLGNTESAIQDSFTDGLLEGPAYTRPEHWQGHSVPSVLLSGNHAQIARWRRDEALRRTAQRRPELLAALSPDEFDAHDRQVLAELS